MKMIKKCKFVILFTLICLAAVMSNIHATDYVAIYDNILANNQFTLYTDEEITDNDSLFLVASNITGNFGTYINSGSIQLSPVTNSCTYTSSTNMTCDFELKQTTYGPTPSEEVLKEYPGISLTQVTDLGDYFTMVTNNKVVINYDESMFQNNDNLKNQYIMNYFNQFSTNNNDISIQYSYFSNVITRTQRQGGTATGVMRKTITAVEFNADEGEYSNDFKTLTSGTLTLKSDIDITQGMLEIYLQQFRSSNYSFVLDGNIVENRVYIKRVEYQNGSQNVLEKHLVTLVKDENIDLDVFNRAGYQTAVNIEAPEPSNDKKSMYIGNYFGKRQITFEDANGSISINRINNSETTTATLFFIERNAQGYFEHMEFHQVPINFVGYNNTVSETYTNLIGTEYQVYADSLSLDIIRNSLSQNFGIAVGPLACENDYSYCDLAYFDTTTKSIEIHRVAISLDDTVSNAFKNAINLKNDNTIDIIIGDDVVIMYDSINQTFYNEAGKYSLYYSCSQFNTQNNDKCNITYRKANTVETHSVKYNVLNKEPSNYFSSLVRSSIELYPGETNNVYNHMNYSAHYFSDEPGNVVSNGMCNSQTNKCPIMLINNNNNLEIHNSTVVLKPGMSSEFSNILSENKISLNAVYKNDSNFMRRASNGVLMSKTKSWTYVTDYTQTEATVVYNDIESHTVGVEYAEGNPEHQQIIDDIIQNIGNNTLTFTVNDMEFINNFYYYDDAYNPGTGNYNSTVIYDAISQLINNKHVSYFYSPDGGAGNFFVQKYAGKLVLYYDGIAYGITDAYIETSTQGIMYVPDETDDTEDAFVEAAQKRINEYLGANSGVTISYKRDVEYGDIDNTMIDVTGYDGKVYELSYGAKTEEILIAKDSSKMKNSTFLASDVNNNINVISDDAVYPANTIVSSNQLDTNSDEYKNILKRLKVDKAQVFDINLFSPTIGDINEFNGENFNVTLPINLTLWGNKKLFAYYIKDDGSVEKHEITLDDFIAGFETNHFSTYIIAEEVDDSVLNPGTSDKLIRWIVLDMFFGIGLLFTLNSILKRRKKASI